MTIFSGRVWKFGDNIDTDVIIPTRYMGLKSIEEMKHYAFPVLRPGFAEQVLSGDIFVCGSNFGCGSSREQAVEVIKALGVRVIIARSFSRIFFRNGLSAGLYLIDQGEVFDGCQEGSELTIDLEKHNIVVEGHSFTFEEMPVKVREMVSMGGLVPFMRKRNQLAGEGKRNG